MTDIAESVPFNFISHHHSFRTRKMDETARLCFTFALYSCTTGLVHRENFTTMSVRVGMIILKMSPIIRATLMGMNYSRVHMLRASSLIGPIYSYVLVQSFGLNNISKCFINMILYRKILRVRIVIRQIGNLNTLVMIIQYKPLYI